MKKSDGNRYPTGPEIDKITRLQVSRSAIRAECLGATGLCIPETASQYVTADKSAETTAAFPVSQEIVVESNANLTSNPNSPSQTHSIP